MMRVVACLIALATAVFGWACLNYTVAFNLDHHQEFAESTGWPEPSPGIYWMGVLILASSMLALGYILGRGKRKP